MQLSTSKCKLTWVCLFKNQRLKEEQLLYIKTLLKQVKEKDKEVEKAAEVGHEQVEAALLQKFDLMKAEEAEVQGIILLCFAWYAGWSINGYETL